MSYSGAFKRAHLAQRLWWEERRPGVLEIWDEVGILDVWDEVEV